MLTQVNVLGALLVKWNALKTRTVAELIKDTGATQGTLRSSACESMHSDLVPA